MYIVCHILLRGKYGGCTGISSLYMYVTASPSHNAYMRLCVNYTRMRIFYPYTSVSKFIEQL